MITDITDRRSDPDPDPSSPLPTREELVACPPTASCDTAVALATEAVRLCPEDSPDRPRLERMASRAIGLLKRARRRDMQLSHRRARGPDYESCFCLGQGGRGEQLAVALPESGAVVAGDDGVRVLTWAEVCPCPDGVELRARVALAAEATAARVSGARVARILGEAGIPRAYARRTRQGWLDAVRLRHGNHDEAARVLDSIAYWEALMGERPPSERCLLLLSGDLGTGKSTLAGLVAMTWARGQRTALYRALPGLALAMRSAPFRRDRAEDPPTGAELISALLSCGLLVLDDLGVEAAGSEAQAERLREWLFSVIGGRIEEGRPTIVTTNLTHDDVARRYGSRLAARLFSPSHAVRVAFAGSGCPDLRAVGGDVSR